MECGMRNARIEGAHSDRAASARKKDGLAVPLPSFHRGGSVSRGDQARPVLPSPPKLLSDKNRKGGCYALIARMHRSPSEVRGARAQEHGSRSYLPLPSR